MKCIILFLGICLAACTNVMDTGTPYHDSITITSFDSPAKISDTLVQSLPAPLNTDTQSIVLATDKIIDTKNTSRTDLVNYALTLDSVNYNYGGTDPATGFDCSGFITYVFRHFGISVPRSSVDFTNVGKEVPVPFAKKGDLILFTGTDSTNRVVGHMGIVIDNSDTLKFVHSSSGRANGVTISPLPGYYSSRFVKVIDIFN